jgi:hypothetical protein
VTTMATTPISAVAVTVTATSTVTAKAEGVTR